MSDFQRYLRENFDRGECEYCHGTGVRTWQFSGGSSTCEQSCNMCFGTGLDTPISDVCCTECGYPLDKRLEIRCCCETRALMERGA